ncbi:alpha/beta hydrolase [Roseomonas rosulenta]|uniref:alpha/beta hydrolase n=1 Tax=Roseomonas rosulenta TaxID=2748667 RepID=UPI0018DFBFB4|nr:alpha/beta fold hydrolase [Roseomonas rosulenta]
MRHVLTAIAIVAGLPLLLVGALWAGQERLIFLTDPRVIAAPPGWERPVIRTADGLELAFLAMEGRPRAPVVLHFHGNGGNAEDRVGLGFALNRAGYSVVLAEYRGYGGNPSRPGEEAIAADAAAILAWTVARFPDRPLVLWGESLGTGVVTRLAENRPGIAAVVLESPFTSVADLARGMYPVVPTDWLLRHRFESLSRLPGVAAPVLVVASAQDRITPADHARRMVEAARDGRLVMLPGGAHPAVLNDAGGQGLNEVMLFLRERVRN